VNEMRGRGVVLSLSDECCQLYYSIYHSLSLALFLSLFLSLALSLFLALFLYSTFVPSFFIMSSPPALSVPLIVPPLLLFTFFSTLLYLF
jgi:hypothetical protein